MNATTIARAIGRLPEEEQREVFDFVGFLHSRHGLRATTAPKRGKPSMAPFIGMWRDRADMIDSTAWVRKQRLAGWGAHG